MPVAVLATLRPVVPQVQAALKRAARTAVARPTPHLTAPVLHVPVQNMFVHRAALHVLLLQAPIEAARRAEAITEVTLPAVLPTAVTIEAAHLQEVPLQVQDAVLAAAIVVEAAAQVQAATVLEAATAQVAVDVQVVAEEDKFRLGFWI